MSRKIDLTGKRFGKLTVIKFAENDKYSRPKWLCKCDCGNEKVIAGIERQTLYCRLFVYKWNIERAINQPIKKEKECI